MIFFMVLSIPNTKFSIVAFRCISANRLLQKSTRRRLVHTYKQAVELAREQDKQLVLFFSDSQCAWCQKTSEILQSEDVIRALDNYVFFEVKWEKNQYLCLKFNIVLFPAFRIVETTEDAEFIIKAISGYMNEETFINWLE
jgi:thioredoxin-related protein